jgi:MYXO-CTERM domain-containing protein
VAAVVAVATVLAAEPSARGFCRTTTCRPGPDACPTDDAGCVTTGTPLSWRATPLVFRFHQRGSALLIDEEARAAVRAAFYRWTDTVCDGGRTSLRFVEGEEIALDKPLVDGPRGEAFGIYFRDLGWPHPGSGEDSQLALTTLDFGLATGVVSYADIEVNTTDMRFATNDTDPGVDLQTVMTHEVGHFIGLSHSAVDKSIMAANLCESGDRCARDRVSSRRIGDDDKAAVCALYPPGAPPAEAAPATSPHPQAPSCAASGGDGGGAAPFAIGVFFAFALRRRARHRAARHRTTRRAGAETPSSVACL